MCETREQWGHAICWPCAFSWAEVNEPNLRSVWEIYPPESFDPIRGVATILKGRVNLGIDFMPDFPAALEELAIEEVHRDIEYTWWHRKGANALPRR